MNRVVEPSPSEMDYLDPPLSHGELRVFNFFNDSLPQGWEIYLRPYLNGDEPDLVLFHPEIGVGVFDVIEEGEDGRYQTRDGCLWDCRGLEPVLCEGRAHPLKRVASYRDSVSRVYCPRLPGKRNTPIVSGLIFPDLKASEARSLLLREANEKHTRDALLVGEDTLLSGDVGRVAGMLACSRGTDSVDDVATSFRGWLAEAEYVRTSMIDLSLDVEQRRASEERTASGYRRVRGSAGSGKTEVVARRAALLAMQGKRVLVSCFNITMMNYLNIAVQRWLRRECGLDDRLRFQSRRRVEIKYFHRWAADRFGPWQVCNGMEHSVESCPKLRELEFKHPAGYDALVVDEGQDFTPCWLRLLSASVRDKEEPGERMLVVDQTQNVYGRSQGWTEMVMSGVGFRGPWFDLRTGYRLPESMLPMVEDYAKSFLLGQDVMLPAGQGSENGRLSLESVVLRWVQCGGEKQGGAETCIDEMVRQARSVGSDRPGSDFAIITQTDEMGNNLLREFYRKRWRRIVDTFDVRRAEQGKEYCIFPDALRDSRDKKLAFSPDIPRPRATTIHSFKGWEARFLVVWIGELSDDRDACLFYVALTRLMANAFSCALTVVCEEPSLRDFGEKWFKDFFEG